MGPASTPSPGVPHAYPAGLSAREVEVLRLLVRGLTNVQIARELVLSEKTVATHLTNIFNKTTSENRTAVTAFAIHHGLASPLPGMALSRYTSTRNERSNCPCYLRRRWHRAES